MDLSPPSRTAVFVGVAWRAWLITIVGGFGVGMSTGLGFVVFENDSEWVAIPGVGLIGSFVGLVVGLLPAAVLAAFVVTTAVPYPGAARTTETTRWAATGIVAVLVVWIGGGAVGWSMVLIMTLVPAVALAWWTAPTTVDWYVGRMEAWHDANPVSDAD